MSITKKHSSQIVDDQLVRYPCIGITIGDVAGIGPEIVLKASADESIRQESCLVIIGDAEFLRKTAAYFNLPFDFRIIKNAAEIDSTSRQPLIFDLDNIHQEIQFGVETALTGKVCAEYIETAVSLCQNHHLDAVATAPISKKALAMGGYSFPGHTEMLASLTNTDEFAMSFFAGQLCVVLLSTHLSLRKAIDLVKKDELVRLIRFTHKTLSKLLRKDVRIAVAGLNPHASEDGLFGAEERLEITPAIDECRKDYTIDVSGPYAADTIFLRAFRGEFDAVISCYHDQATIAVKCLSFGESVNVTLGLPIIRTSVDHGTAFDIAGKNIADFESMITSIKLAINLARNS